MAENIKKVVQESFMRCKAREGFFERFYELFVESSPEVRAKFKNTDMEKQAQMLQHSLYTTKLATLIGANMKHLALLHSRKGKDVPPELYELWLEALLQAVMEYDPLYSFDIEQAWRRLLRPGIEYMQSHYDVD